MKHCKLNIRTLAHLSHNLVIDFATITGVLSDKQAFVRTKERITGRKKRTTHQALGKYAITLKRVHGILKEIPLHNSQHGAIKGRSIITNARVHLRPGVMIKLDVANCFPNISEKMVFFLFYESLGCSPQVATVLSKLTTMNGELAQGFSTSPIIANLLLRPVAERISGLVESRGGRFTIYVDDLTISISAVDEKLMRLVMQIVFQEGFALNKQKNKILTNHEEQVTASIKTNKCLDVRSSYYKKVKRVIRRLEFAVVHGKRPTPHQINSLRGKVRHISQFNPGAGNTYKKILHKALTATPSA